MQWAHIGRARRSVPWFCLSLQELTGELPFKDVFLHTLVRDKYGHKMSKSRGNVIDPLWVVYGITLEELHENVASGNLAEKEVKAAQKVRSGCPRPLPWPCPCTSLRPLNAPVAVATALALLATRGGGQGLALIFIPTGGGPPPWTPSPPPPPRSSKSLGGV